MEELEASGGGLGEYDDGKYKAKVVKAYTAMSENSGRPQNVIGFKFLDGDYRGQTVFQYQGLDNKFGVKIAVATMKKLGQEIEGPDELDDADAKLQKEQPVVEIRLRTKGEYQNVIVAKVLGEDEDVDVDEDEDDEDEEKPKSKSKPSKSDDADDESDDDDSKDSDDGSDADEDDDSDSEDDEDEDSEDDDEESDEDEEEEKKPAKKEKEKPAKKSKADDADEDEDESDDEDEDAEEEVALEVGKKIKFKNDGETVKGKIVKVNEKARTVRAKLADGTKVDVSVDDIIDVL